MMPVSGLTSNQSIFVKKNTKPVRFGADNQSGMKNLRSKMLLLGLLAAPMAPALMPSTAEAAPADRVQFTRSTVGTLDWEDLRKQRRQGGFRTVDAAILSDIRQSPDAYTVKPGDTLYDIAEAVKNQWGSELDKQSATRIVNALKRQHQVHDPLRLPPGLVIDLKAMREHFNPGSTAVQPAPEAPVEQPPVEVAPTVPAEPTPVPGGEVTPEPAEPAPVVPEPVPEPAPEPTPTPAPVPGGTVTPETGNTSPVEQVAPKPAENQQTPAKQHKNQNVLYGLLLAMGGVLATIIGMLYKGLRQNRQPEQKSPEAPVKPEPPTGPQPPDKPEGGASGPSTEMKADAVNPAEEVLPPAPPEVSPKPASEVPPAGPAELTGEGPTDLPPENPSDLPGDPKQPN